MTDIQPSADRELTPRRRRMTIGLVGVTALAAVAFFAFGSRGGAPGVTPPDGGGGGAVSGSCIVYDLEILAQQEYAFDGTVVAIDGEQVTFAVGTWYRGTGDPAVTLTEHELGSGAVTSVILVDFKVGKRYLVSGSGGIVTGCGYSGEYNETTAAEWAGVFGD